MIFLAEKFVISIIIRIFAASVLAKPLNNAQIVRGVFIYTQIWQILYLLQNDLNLQSIYYKSTNFPLKCLASSN